LAQNPDVLLVTSPSSVPSERRAEMARVAPIILASLSCCALVVFLVASQAGTTEIENSISQLRGSSAARRLFGNQNEIAQMEQAKSFRLKTTTFGSKQESSSSKVYNQIVTFIMQLLFGAAFYHTVTTKYPLLVGANDISRNIMSQNAAFRINSNSICIQSLCCWPAVLAHVLDRSATCTSYWTALLAAICFPCCTTYWAVNMTDMNEKLGGSKRDCLEALVISCCCPCCEIARAGDALDAATGATTGCFSVQLPSNTPGE